MIKVREAGVKDITTLKDLDLKCQIYPADPDLWAYLLTPATKGVYLAHIGHTPVGYAVCADIEILETKQKHVRIQLFGSLARFRGNGVGKALLEKVEDLARNLHIKWVSAVIPEIHCLPDDPDDVSLWLRFQGFRAKRIVKDGFVMYGDKHDGFVFEKEVTL